MLLFLISRSGNRACVGAEQSSRPKLPRLGVSWEEHKIPLPPLLSSHTQEHTHTHILTHTQRPPPVSVPMYLRCQMAEDKSSWGKTAWWPLPSLTRTFSQIEDTWKYRAVVVSWGSVVGGRGGVVGNTHQWTPSHTERRWAPKSRVWCTTHRVGFKKKKQSSKRRGFHTLVYIGPELPPLCLPPRPSYLMILSHLRLHGSGWPALRPMPPCSTHERCPRAFMRRPWWGWWWSRLGCSETAQRRKMR